MAARPLSARSLRSFARRPIVPKVVLHVHPLSAPSVVPAHRRFSGATSDEEPPALRYLGNRFTEITGHNYGWSRRYYGPLKGVILDWSGTTVDKYVIAPAEVFVKVFDKAGVPISMSEAREPMGLRKDLHIAEICKNPSVAKRWKKAKGKNPDADDVAAMFKDFIPSQLEVLTKYATLIPGAAETVKILQNEFGVKIGSTTGFMKEMVDILLTEAAKQGYVPDSSVAGDEVEHGARPKPFMVYRNMDLLDVHPIQAVLKVDDTVGGVGEGLEAGCWTVGLARYSNYMNINTLEEEADLSPEEIDYKLQKSRDILRKSGAHYVVDDITGLPSVMEDINRRLAEGGRP